MNSVVTEKLFINKFKELLLSDDYKNISVNKICSLLNLKRQTFYYHFEDLSSLVFSALLAEDISGFRDSKNQKETIESIIKFLCNNRQMIIRLFELDAGSIIESFIYNSLYSKFGKIFNDLYFSKLKIKEINELNFLFSSYLSKAIFYFISLNKFPFEDKFQSHIASIYFGLEEKIVENLIKSR